MRIDLHTHTTASDGVLTPTELVERAAREQVDVVGVTDHDTVTGVAEAQSAGEPLGVRVVAGIELTSRHDGRAVHVLGYFLDPLDEDLRRVLDAMQAERLDRVKRMVRRLNELGYELTLDEVLRYATGAIVARPHVARALVARGYIGAVRDAFTPELIGDGGRADVSRTPITPREAVDVIAAAGGAPVIAHPGLAHHLGTHQPIPDALIDELAARGLRGLEVDHPDHDLQTRDRLRRLASRLGLVVTGGSDFHGETPRPIGYCTTTDESLASLEAPA